jgi:hypothetical protein
VPVEVDGFGAPPVGGTHHRPAHTAHGIGWKPWIALYGTRLFRLIGHPDSRAPPALRSFVVAFRQIHRAYALKTPRAQGSAVPGAVEQPFFVLLGPGSSLR